MSSVTSWFVLHFQLNVSTCSLAVGTCNSPEHASQLGKLKQNHLWDANMEHLRCKWTRIALHVCIMMIRLRFVLFFFSSLSSLSRTTPPMYIHEVGIWRLKLSSFHLFFWEVSTPYFLGGFCSKSGGFNPCFFFFGTKITSSLGNMGSQGSPPVRSGDWFYQTCEVNFGGCFFDCFWWHIFIEDHDGDDDDDEIFIIIVLFSWFGGWDLWILLLLCV